MLTMTPSPNNDGAKPTAQPRTTARLVSFALMAVGAALVVLAVSFHQPQLAAIDHHGINRAFSTDGSLAPRGEERHLATDQGAASDDRQLKSNPHRPDVGVEMDLIVVVEDEDEDEAGAEAEAGDADDEKQREEEQLLEAMKARLLPGRSLVTEDLSAHRYSPNQFLHLHHMKTGGTSLDNMLKCIMENVRRVPLEQDHYDRCGVPHMTLHECSKMRWDKCISGQNPRCQADASDATFLSFCAPLRHLPFFGWNQQMETAVHTRDSAGQDAGFAAVTVLRDPVARVWSMYRFRTKGCYQCKPLLEVYKEIDDGVSEASEICTVQLSNHLVANLLSTESSLDASDEDKVKEAIHNMQYFFTLIGLTEELPTTVEMMHKVFPWTGNVTVLADFPVDEKKARLHTCDMPHANASPQNNRCGADGSHLELPSKPDEETRAAIIAHNQLDIQLYEAAKTHFQRQKSILKMR